MLRLLQLVPLLLGMTLSPTLFGIDVDALPQEAPPTVQEQPGEAPSQDSANTTLYILMYHNFVREGEDYNEWTVTDTRFREDLQWLADHGYTTVLPSQVIAGEPLPEKAVLITIDDGYVSNYDIAFPLLEEFRAKAVISLIVERRETGYDNAMSWETCRALAHSQLIEFGSHTYNAHEEDRWLARMEGETQAEYEARIFPDVQKSVDLIKERLGIDVRFFAYPQGRTDPWSDEFIAGLFDMTVTTEPVPADLSQGLYKLPRFMVSMDLTLDQFMP